MKNKTSFGVALFFAACIGSPLLPVQAQSMAPGAMGPAVGQQQVPTIDVKAFKALAASKKRFFLIDVRQPDEFARGAIPNAVLMPLDTLPNRYRQIPKGVKLVVYCRSGHRSAQAVAFLKAHGYDRAVSLAGGYTAWSGVGP